MTTPTRQLLAPSDQDARLAAPRPADPTAPEGPTPAPGACTAPKVGELMSSPAYVVRADESLAQLVQLLDGWTIGTVPVVDGEGRVVGVVGYSDLLAVAMRGIAGEVRCGTSVSPGPCSVSEVMSSPVVMVSADLSAFEAGELMLARGLRWLPVVDDGRPIGVIARSDLVRASLRDDRDIRQDVLIRLLSLSAAIEFEAIAVRVRGGVVTLSGELSDRAEIDLARQAAEEVLGVRTVRDRLVVRSVGG